MQLFSLSVCAVLVFAGCSDPLRHRPTTVAGVYENGSRPLGLRSEPNEYGHRDKSVPVLGSDASPDDYVRHALLSSPELEAAYQRWRAQSERIVQVGALPDPRLSVGFFANEVETRVGAQQARIGISQQFPWLEQLRAREDAAAARARAAWIDYLRIELSLSTRVISAMYELHYLDQSIAVTGENLGLLRSFEDSVRARYRVGTGSHPDLVRTQVELGQLEDRLSQLETSRPAMVARLNAMLDRPHDAPIVINGDLTPPVIDEPLGEMIARAEQVNPQLLAISELVEEQRSLTEAARFAGRPELTVGVETILTNNAINPSIPESGDDPLMLSFSINLPIWRDKYDAGVRESIANRLALSSSREHARNELSAMLSGAHFDYTDAQRRGLLYEGSLIPKAYESLQSTLGAYRTGTSGFTDLLDAERTLLEFRLASARARADRGIAAARLRELIGLTESSSELTNETQSIPSEGNE